MPTYSHSNGVQTVSKRVSVTDAFVRNDDGPVLEFVQPANSTLSEVIVRFTSGLTSAASSSAGFEIGTASSGDQLGSDSNAFLAAGTTIPANSIYFLVSGNAAAYNLDTVNNNASPAAAKGFSESERTLYFTPLHSDTAITTNADIEVNFVFTVFNKAK